MNSSNWNPGEPPVVVEALQAWAVENVELALQQCVTDEGMFFIIDEGEPDDPNLVFSADLEKPDGTGGFYTYSDRLENVIKEYVTYPVTGLGRAIETADLNYMEPRVLYVEKMAQMARGLFDETKKRSKEKSGR